MKSESRKNKREITVLIIAAVLAVASLVVFQIANNKDSWLTKSTIQRKALPSDQCVKTDKWYQDDTGRLIDEGEAGYIIAGMEYFYEKTGVQPYLWGTPIYDKLFHECNSPYDRAKMRDAILSEKYEELFGSDGGHVLIALSDSQITKVLTWYCYVGGNAKMQVIDDEAVQILLDCLSFMLNPQDAHPGRTIGDAFVKAADTMMKDQTYVSYAVAIVIVGVFIVIAAICISSIKKSGEENVAYHKTLKEREKARKEEAIAYQKQADLERKKYEDELETQYMAIPCPNCGGTGNKIRKGTVGLCMYCGTAIKVGRDGKIEFLSNDD